MTRFGPTLACLLLLASSPALAQEPRVSGPILDRVISEGYDVYEVTRTWLGRILITARNDTFLREIVLNRTTGEILRDRLFPLRNSGDVDSTQPPSPTTSQSGAPAGSSPDPDDPDGASGPGGGGPAAN